MTRKLLDIEDELRTGIQPEKVFSKGVLWRDGENIIAAEGGIRPTYPQGVFTNKVHNGAVSGMIAVNFGDGVNRLFSGSAGKLAEFNSTIGNVDRSIGSGYAANGRSNLWSMIEFQDNIYATSGAFLQEWINGAGTFTNYSVESVFTSAEIFRKLNNHIIAYNTNIDSRSYFWCSANNTAVWIPLGANSAGGDNIRELDTEIVAVENMRGNHIVYSKNEAHLVTYVGTPFYFQHREITKGIGAISRNSVVQVGNRHYGMGENGIWVFDGNSFSYIDEPIRKKVLTNNVNQDFAFTVNAFHSNKENMVIFFWPGKDSIEPDNAWGFNYIEGTWWQLAYARTVGIESGVFDFGISGDEFGNLFRQFEPGDSTDSVSFGAEAIPARPLDRRFMFKGFGELGFGQGGFGDVILNG